MNETRYWVLYRAAFKRISLTANEIEEIKMLYRDEGREKIQAHAAKKKIIPAVAYLLVKIGVDIEYWKQISDSFRARNQRVVCYLDDFYKALDNAGVDRIAVVENFGALLYAEADLALFGSGDSDNYGDKNIREQIVTALTSAGYRVSDITSGNLFIASEIFHKDTDVDNYHFGINWDVTNRTKLPCLTSKSDFLNWKACTFYKDTHIRIPPAEALMYICLMHIAVHGFCRTPDIRLYVDIANMASKPLDWSEIEKWAKKDGNCLRVSVASTLANRFLGVNIPDEIMRLGNPRRRERLINLVSDPNKNILRDFPSRTKGILIDIESCDGGVIEGMRYVFFPPSQWLREKYGSSVIGWVKHLRNLL